MSETSKPATWRVVLAFILDLFVSFFVIGYIIALLTGGTTGSGFALTGLPAILAIVGWIGYMVLMPRKGGRVFQRLLKAR